MRYLFAALAALLSLPAEAGEIRDIYYRANGDSQSDVIYEPYRGAPAGDHGITQIGIERTICLGPCPIYTFIAKSDGRVRFVGESNVDYQGMRTGTVPVWSFDWLARFIKESSFMTLDRAYAVPVTDHPTAYILVVMNGQTKVVSSYGGAGPAILWAIGRLIDDLEKEVVWN